jgi:hypothetical protein
MAYLNGHSRGRVIKQACREWHAGPGPFDIPQRPPRRVAGATFVLNRAIINYAADRGEYRQAVLTCCVRCHDDIFFYEIMQISHVGAKSLNAAVKTPRTDSTLSLSRKVKRSPSLFTVGLDSPTCVRGTHSGGTFGGRKRSRWLRAADGFAVFV